MTIRTRPATDAYRDGWDRVFGRNREGGERDEFKDPYHAMRPKWDSPEGRVIREGMERNVERMRDDLIERVGKRLAAEDSPEDGA